MSFESTKEEPDFRSVKAWLKRWEPLIRSVDFTPARALFDAEVISFGTHADLLQGIDALENEQWRQVWPTIDDFRFNDSSLRVNVSPDRRMAFLIVTWQSTGYREDGRSFERLGRATVALRRDDPDAEWRGIHTHFSLYPGQPRRSHGRRDPLS